MRWYFQGVALIDGISGIKVLVNGILRIFSKQNGAQLVNSSLFKLHTYIFFKDSSDSSLYRDRDFLFFPPMEPLELQGPPTQVFIQYRRLLTTYMSVDHIS